MSQGHCRGRDIWAIDPCHHVTTIDLSMSHGLKVDFKQSLKIKVTKVKVILKVKVV